MLKTKCSKCHREIKRVKPELFGILLLIWAPLNIIIFGFLLISIIYSILSIIFGIKIIRDRESKKYVCEDCLARIPKGN